MTIFDDGSTFFIAVALASAVLLGAALAVVRFSRLPMFDPFNEQELQENLACDCMNCTAWQYLKPKLVHDVKNSRPWWTP